MKNLNEILRIKNNTLKNSNLIHCLTNPISINQCANIILATGSKPIMAEHPSEVENITLKSNCLYINLGNITDSRMKSMDLSCSVASQNNIPIIMDLVGVGISDIRYSFAKDLVSKYKFSILKGNISEIRAFAETNSNALGIDAGDADLIEYNIENSLNITHALALKYNCVVISSGKFDLISSPKELVMAKNGTQMMSNVTGTGCMLGAITASYLSNGDAFNSAILGVSTLAIAGELSSKIKTPMKFLWNMIDNVYLMDDKVLTGNINLEVIK